MTVTRRHIEIMDTTLRDGEQTSGVSFSAIEKLTIAQVLLTEVNVDRIEIASARVSQGEMEAVKKVTYWASEHDYLDRIEVLTFVDGIASIQWMEKAGAKVTSFVRINVGEGIEKKEENFAEEVMKQVQASK